MQETYSLNPLIVKVIINVFAIGAIKNFVAHLKGDAADRGCRCSQPGPSFGGFRSGRATQRVGLNLTLWAHVARVIGGHGRVAQRLNNPMIGNFFEQLIGRKDHSLGLLTPSPTIDEGPHLRAPCLLTLSLLPSPSLLPCSLPQPLPRQIGRAHV